MKKRRIPDKSDLDAIRAQILTFACDKHDFALETDKFLPSGEWYGEFIVSIKGSNKNDRLYCSAPLGEHFIRFGLDLSFKKEVWEKNYITILQKISEFDSSLYPGKVKEEKSILHCRLFTRAWIPNFNQRIFGLTLSNLLDCKEAVISRF